MTEPAHEDGPATQAHGQAHGQPHGQPHGQADGSPGPSLLTLLQALFTDARILIEAETGYYRALIGFALGRAKIIAVLVVMTVFFMFFALMAGIMGLLLALAPLIGAWWAAGLVTAVLVVLGASCAWNAWRRARHMIRVLTGNGSNGS